MLERLRGIYNGVTNVQFNFNTYYNLILNKCLKIFQWDNLPSTINPRILEELLILNGVACFTKLNGNYYCLGGSVGGDINVNYQPINFIIANPILGSKELKIRQVDGSDSTDGLDGILVFNSDVDFLESSSSNLANGGLSGLIYQTAGLLADNISSINISQINSRVSLLFTADSEAEADTGEKVLKDIYSGKPYRILSQNILEKFGVNPVAQAGQSNTIMTLIEARRAILQDFFNEIGIGYQGNMKRERVNTAETDLMTESLDINIQSMLKSREAAADQINQLYGLNISVRLNPSVYNENNNNATEDSTTTTLEEDSTTTTIEEDSTTTTQEETKDKEAAADENKE